MSFAADKMNQFFTSKQKTQEEKEEANKKTEISIKKKKLRDIAKEKGEAYVIEIAQGFHINDASDVQKREIVQLYKDVLGLDNLKNTEIDDLKNVLKPDSLLEKFAYRN
jgi:hypothetical protein